MKKGVLFLALSIVLILSLSIVYAADNSTYDEKAYSCLENKVKSKCSSLTLEQQVFSLLALSYSSAIQSECKTSLKALGKNDECWPKDSCKIKDTALATIALKSVGSNTDKSESWLINKNITNTGVEWYLEIDSNEATQCKLTYDSIEKTISIADNKKLSGSPGDCLSFAYDNYWMKIKDSCLNKKFEVSCDKGFISTLLYKKANSNVWYVSSDVQSASASAKTSHHVNSYCLGVSSCNYEDNLWAMLALSQTGNDIKGLLPYLVVFAEDNEKLFPYAFIYKATSSDDSLVRALKLQKDDGYWDLNQRFYDTALGLLALHSSSTSEGETKAKDWLQSNQGGDGCWNSGNIRDTGFLLWAGFPKTPVSDGDDRESCTAYSRFCISAGDCSSAGGTSSANFKGCSGIEVCCDKDRKVETCSEKDGTICSGGKVCSVSTTTASDGSCCIGGDCVDEESECEEFSFSCKSTCSSSEESVNYNCDSGKTCCKAKPPAKSGSLWWLWLLIILIILIILGIIFKDKLRVYMFKLKGGFKKSDVTKTRPGFPPASVPVGMRRVLPSRPIFSQFKPQAKPASKTDSELDDTLRKLRDMSK